VVLLSTEQREELEAVVRRGTSEHRTAQRSRIVLLRADGVPVLEIRREALSARGRLVRAGGAKLSAPRVRAAVVLNDAFDLSLARSSLGVQVVAGSNPVAPTI